MCIRDSLQGTVKDLQEFLADYFPQFHLVKDRSLGRPASIKDSIMQPFMNVMTTHPEQVTFLRDDFEKFAKDHVKLLSLIHISKALHFIYFYTLYTWSCRCFNKWQTIIHPFKLKYYEMCIRDRL